MLDLIIFLPRICLPLKHCEVEVHAEDYISRIENLAMNDELEPGALEFFESIPMAQVHTYPFLRIYSPVAESPVIAPPACFQD